MTEEIKKGMKVEILTREKKNITGIVEEIGTKESEKGKMVLLKTGEVGRVQKIIDDKKKAESEAEKLIKKGENYQREFKSEALWSLNYTNQQIAESKSNDLHTHKHKASKVIIARSIVALLNSQGGNLIIGVKEKKNEKGEFEIVGIEKDLEKLKAQGKDNSQDGYKRMIIDDIIRAYFPFKIYNNLNDYIKFTFEEINNKLVCNIKVQPSRSRIFLNLEGRKIFMIRTETETRQIQDEELVDYCMRRFLS
ncbi:DUF2196 domain-containing protein [Candidatus Pacearchaeota archaeon]|nr:DUF2196 domain-containing protein [Candidatus Pacearchaeota archaeon]